MAGGDATLSVSDNDIFKIEAVFDGGATDEYCYYEKDITNISTTLYNNYAIRWKTSHASAVTAKVYFDYTSGTDSTVSLGSSTSWTTTTGTLTSGLTLDKVRVYADDTGTDGTYYTYYDFILVYQGLFTFPSVTGNVELNLLNRYADIPIPGRIGDETQYLGMESPEIIISGEMDTDTDWGSPDGEYLYKIFMLNDTEPWQWLTSDIVNCKATPRTFNISQRSDTAAQRVYNIGLKLYSLSGGDTSEWSANQWLGL